MLLLIGNDSGECGEEIHKKVERLGLKENVMFLGIRSDIPELLQAMDVFLFPSLFEGFGIVALEAQAAGIPTVVSNRIPIECKVTDLLESVSLDENTDTWVKGN